jgi:predicted DNA-binding transcriptional regulator YafY
MKLDRLLAITMLLINRKRITATELAEYFEVSIRTIYRDIEAINQAGIPVVAYQGTGGGFEVVDNYKLERQLLNSEDLQSIMVALKAVNTTLDDHTVTNAISKLKVLAPETGPEQTEQMILDFSPWGGNKNQPIKINLIKKAITERRLIAFHYTNYQGENISRLVEPMTLILKGFTWYFYGYCRAREDFRFFRLSRVRDLTISAETFIRRETEPDNSLWEKEWNSGPLEQLTLKFAARMRAMVEDYFDEDKIKVIPDGDLIVTTQFPNIEWTYHHILSYGDGVEVLEPHSFREIIAQKARDIQKIYARPANPKYLEKR